MSTIAHGKWTAVTPAHPCPICGHGGWCRRSPDGSQIACRRVEFGGQQKSYKDGSPYYLHRQGGSRPVPPPVAPTQKHVQRADADILHKTYSALLGYLVLVQTHRENLQRRGLSAEAIRQNGYRSLPVQGRSRITRYLQERFGDAVLQVPGLAVKQGEKQPYLTIVGSAGLLIPVRDTEGRIVALQVRRNDPCDSSQRYRWLSSSAHNGPGSGAPVHCPRGVVCPCAMVRVTEGPLKCDVAYHLSGIPTLAISCATSWRGVFSVLQRLQVKTCRLAWDMDWRTNPHVARGLVECARALQQHGYTLEIETWQEGKGIDDALLLERERRCSS